MFSLSPSLSLSLSISLPLSLKTNQIPVSDALQTLIGVHCTTKIRIRFGGVKRKVPLNQFFERIKTSQLLHIFEPDLERVSLFSKQKNSIAKCKSFVRGVALWHKRMELIADKDMSKHDIKNKFTNYQRTDRTAGDRLENDFIAKNSLAGNATIGEMEKKISVSCILFDAGGYISFISPRVLDCNREVICFCVTNDMIYLITNLKGFCRQDKIKVN